MFEQHTHSPHRHWEEMYTLIIDQPGKSIIEVPMSRVAKNDSSIPDPFFKIDRGGRTSVKFCMVE